jgi:hypothetical protein
MKLLIARILDTYNYRCPFKCWVPCYFNWNNAGQIVLESPWIWSQNCNTYSAIYVMYGLIQSVILLCLHFYMALWPTTFADASRDDANSGSLYKSSVKPWWSRSHHFVCIICGNRANEIINLIVHQPFRSVHTPSPYLTHPDPPPFMEIHI